MQAEFIPPACTGLWRGHVRRGFIKLPGELGAIGREDVGHEALVGCEG